MYGIVNKTVKGLITEQFGEQTWQNVKERSGVKYDDFVSNEAYDDSVTYKLAGAAAEELGISVEQVLHAFGEYWILKTGMEHYGSLMEAGGDNLKEFLENLPNFHSRVMLMFPDLTPPEFRTSDAGDNDIKVHYYSEREGLQGFVEGLLSGLSKMFKTETQIECIAHRGRGDEHDIFHVKW